MIFAVRLASGERGDRPPLVVERNLGLAINSVLCYGLWQVNIFRYRY